jgi:hypothetical protein
LWRFLERHGVIDSKAGVVKSYDGRRKAFERHWQELLVGTQTAPNQLAATLYLWADEAERFGYSYC